MLNPSWLSRVFISLKIESLSFLLSIKLLKDHVYLSLSVTSYRGGVGGYHSSSLCSLSSTSRMMMLLDRLFLKLDLITLDSALSRLVQAGLMLSVSLTVSPVWAPSLSSGLRISMSVMYLWISDTGPVSHDHCLN